MINLVRYIKERFPPLLVIFLSAGYAAYSVGICTQIGGQIEHVSITFLLIAISFIFLLLRQRILDEFKDFKHDSKNYSKRPLQRGLVTKPQLIVIGVFAFLGEILTIALISPMSIVFYLPVLAFSFLMAKEFFVSKWLKVHQTAYFISHQSLYIFLVLWMFLTFRINFSINVIFTAVALICIMAGAEIVRKYEIRKNPHGKPINDTYITTWGKTGARVVLEFMIAIPGLMIAIITESIVPCAIALIGVIAIEAFSKKQLYARLIAALVFMIQAILVIIK